jgi:hypothetical protein
MRKPLVYDICALVGTYLILRRNLGTSFRSVLKESSRLCPRQAGATRLSEISEPVAIPAVASMLLVAIWIAKVAIVAAVS